MEEKRGNKWTEQDIEFLRNNYTEMEHIDLGLVLGKTPHAVRNKCCRLQLRKKPLEWTEAEDGRLKELYKSFGEYQFDLDRVAKKMGRSRWGVGIRASRLGLGDYTRTKREGRKDRRRFKGDTQALNDYLSATMREWHVKNEHPCGFKGKKHSEKTRRLIREKNRKAATKITSEQREEMTLKGRKTRMERYETLGRPVVQTNPYSRARGGTRDDLGFYVRSRWEANYARYLRFLKDKGEIHDWEYEPDIFVFHGEIRGSISYTPDFKVTENNGRVVYHEVKGWMDSKSKTKLKRMKKHYPDVEIIIIAWKEYNAISKYSGLIENWED